MDPAHREGKKGVHPNPVRHVACSPGTGIILMARRRFGEALFEAGKDEDGSIVKSGSAQQQPSARLRGNGRSGLRRELFEVSQQLLLVR